jgi:hypothetical protein
MLTMLTMRRNPVFFFFRASLVTPLSRGNSILPREISLFSLGKMKIL